MYNLCNIKYFFVNIALYIKLEGYIKHKNKGFKNTFKQMINELAEVHFVTVLTSFVSFVIYIYIF